MPVHSLVVPTSPTLSPSGPRVSRRRCQASLRQANQPVSLLVHQQVCLVDNQQVGQWTAFGEAHSQPRVSYLATKYAAAGQPTMQPSGQPSSQPSTQPSGQPTGQLWTAIRAADNSAIRAADIAAVYTAAGQPTTQPSDNRRHNRQQPSGSQLPSQGQPIHTSVPTYSRLCSPLPSPHRIPRPPGLLAALLPAPADHH